MIHSAQNKVVSKGIFLYHSFYKPIHLSDCSPHDQAILTQIIHYFTTEGGTDYPLSTILQSLGIPLSSLSSIYSTIQQLHPQCGLSASIENHSIIIHFSSSLFVSSLSLINRYHIEAGLQPQENEEEDDEEVQPSQSIARKVYLRDSFLSVDKYLLTIIQSSPTQQLALSELVHFTGFPIKRLTKKLNDLEKRGILESQLVNKKRSFVKMFKVHDRMFF